MRLSKYKMKTIHKMIQSYTFIHFLLFLSLCSYAMAELSKEKIYVAEVGKIIKY